MSRKGKVWPTTREAIDRAIELVNAGMTYAEASRELGYCKNWMSETLARNRIRKLDLRLRNKINYRKLKESRQLAKTGMSGWNHDKIGQAIELVNSGATKQQASIAMGFNSAWLQGVLWTHPELWAKLDKPKRRASLTNKPGKHYTKRQ